MLRVIIKIIEACSIKEEKIAAVQALGAVGPVKVFFSVVIGSSGAASCSVCPADNHFTISSRTESAL